MAIPNPPSKVMTEVLVKSVLKTAAAHPGIFSATMEGGVKLPQSFEIISRSIHKFWTQDFLDDLIVNDGSAIFMPAEMLISFGRFFYAQMHAAYYQLDLDLQAATGIKPGTDPDKHNGIFNHLTLIEMVAEIIMFEQRSTGIVMDVDGLSISLLPDHIRNYYGASTLGGNVKSKIVSFLEVNNWLIPFYLLFATDAYEELNLTLDSALNR